MRGVWRWFWRPSRLALGTLVVFGGLMGVVATGGFVWFVEYSNTEAFCTGCHEMSWVDAEYKQSIHAANRTGVAATCADCHVPKPWVAKMTRKIAATKELYHKAIGTISTEEKFEAHRLDMATRVWDSMRSNGSAECRNCHAWERMIAESQKEKARTRHARARERGETCIGCHKGIAHKLPDVKPAIEAARAALIDRVGKDSAEASVLYPVRSVNLYGDEGAAKSLGTVLAATPLNLVTGKGKTLRVRISGWRADGKRALIYGAEGRKVLQAGMKKSALSRIKTVSPPNAAGWEAVEIEGWIKSEHLVTDADHIWAFAERLYSLECGRCHMAYPPDWYGVEDWRHQVKAMKPMVKLGKEDMRLIQLYLQTKAPIEAAYKQVAETDRHRQ